MMKATLLVWGVAVTGLMTSAVEAKETTAFDPFSGRHVAIGAVGDVTRDATAVARAASTSARISGVGGGDSRLLPDRMGLIELPRISRPPLSPFRRPPLGPFRP